MYVSACCNPSFVKVIDTASNTIVTTIAVGNFPGGMDVTPDGSRLYVPHYNSNTVSVINTATNTVVTTISVGAGPGSVRVSPDGSRAYVASQSSNSVTVINTATNSVVTTIPGISLPRTLDFTPDGARVYVASDGRVQVIDTATSTVVGNIPFTTAINGNPGSIAITSVPIRMMSVTGDLAFGAVTVGTTSSRTLTIGNAGNTTMTVSSIAFPAGFSGDWPGGTITAGGSRDVVATFTPSLPTSYGGTVTVNANYTSGTNTIVASGREPAGSSP